MKRRCMASVIICTLGSCENSEYILNHCMLMLATPWWVAN